MPTAAGPSLFATLARGHTSREASPRALGAERAKVAFGVDEHGSYAPVTNGISSFLPLTFPSGGLPGALVAAHEAPPGRGLAHGLAAGFGGAAGSLIGGGGGALGGSIAGGVGGLLAGLIARSVLGQGAGRDLTPALGGLGAIIGGAAGGIAGSYRGAYRGTQIGQNFARRGDPVDAEGSEPQVS
jgi:hypothetical protein